MKEKTVKLYKEDGIRLQMVQIFTSERTFCYEIRKNRCILLRTYELEVALTYFRGQIYQIISQFKLF